MKTILVLGAGRSSASLIRYLLGQATINDWSVIIGDADIDSAKQRVEQSPRIQVIEFNINDKERASQVIASADIVISLLPAIYHPEVARHCLAARRHLVTASYVSDAMKQFHHEAKASGLLFLNECGLDPGIDHMTAMQLIDRIKSEGGSLISFESFTGGLIAPETDTENPWRYKFTWNPRNVVLAGQGTAKFLQDGLYKYIPYQQLFRQTTPVHVPGLGAFEGYANRNSLSYIDIYGLHGIQTMLRGTLRFHGFCEAWNILVQLGCCDDSFKMERVDQMSHGDFINSFIVDKTSGSVGKKLRAQLGDNVSERALHCLTWSGLFDDEPIGIKEGTPAQILEYILNKKWRLNRGDKDMIVMWHRFGYREQGQLFTVQASLVVTGDDEMHTAMAKTVGLPLGIAAKLLLTDKIQERGVAVPVSSEFYTPILHELSELGIAIQHENANQGHD